MTTTKQKAIELFEKQRIQLHDFVINDKAWITFTADLITKYIGSHSNQYYNLNEWSKSTGITDARLAREKREEVERILHYCIEYIKDNGVLKQEQSNTVYGLPNWAPPVIVCAIIAISWVTGMYTGRHSAESGLVQEVNRLRKDSLKMAPAYEFAVTNGLRFDQDDQDTDEPKLGQNEDTPTKNEPSRTKVTQKSKVQSKPKNRPDESTKSEPSGFLKVTRVHKPKKDIPQSADKSGVMADDAKALYERQETERKRIELEEEQKKRPDSTLLKVRIVPKRKI